MRNTLYGDPVFEAGLDDPDWIKCRIGTCEVLTCYLIRSMRGNWYAQLNVDEPRPVYVMGLSSRDELVKFLVDAGVPKSAIEDNPDTEMEGG